jgi:16S rRNA (cytidine1402-2'-O)-methyltransferase
MGALFVVATPIGNLGDLTLRAIETLRTVDRVVAEDTRRTRGLLSHLGISGKPLDRLDAHAAAPDVERVVARLREGERIALVTDAGTPLVSDPGAALVKAAIDAGVPVVAIPGACAAVAALCVSGLSTGGFRFVGFLPRSGPERREAVALVAATPETVVLYESPQRIAETLADLATQPPREWVGEITLVLGPAALTAGPSVSDEEVDRRIDEGLARGRRAKDLAEELSLETSLSRREVYGRIVARRR